MRFHSYVKSTEQILKRYNGSEPFASFLKKYFSENKKHGSRDRKQISHLCYCYFRLGKALMDIPIEERILTGLFVCSKEPNELLEQLKPDWNQKVDLPVEEKLTVVGYSPLMDEIFPWKDQLSEGVDHKSFSASFLVQPHLFLRLRGGREEIAKKKLTSAGIYFKELTDSCLSLPNASRIEEVVDLDVEVVVQDYNSQQVAKYFNSAISNVIPTIQGARIKAWDCCAGSGGKSLLLYDLDTKTDLTVSDVRESIIINLHRRFERAGIKKYRSFVIDITSDEVSIAKTMGTSNYDLIICDAPCTGSGTWSRTPEQLYFFDEKKIETYADLQRKIVANVVPHLKKNGWLVYITCSVFEKENKNIAEFITRELNLQLIEMELLKGYDKRADTMFVALFRKIKT